MQVGTVSGLRLCFLGSHTFVPQVGCVRIQFHTVRRNLKLFLLMQVNVWTEFPLLISGTWLLKCCILPSIKQGYSKKRCRESCCVTNHQESTPRTKLRLKFNTMILSYPMSSKVKSSQFGAMHHIFEDNEAVIKMIIKGRTSNI